MVNLRQLMWFLLRYGILVAGFGAFLAGLFFSYQGLIQQRELIEKESRINVWFLAQTEIEFLRFKSSVKDYAITPDRNTAELARQRFEIFWSRLPPLLEGSQTAELREIEGLVEDVKQMIVWLEELEPAIENLEAVSPKGLTELDARLEGMLEPVHDWVRRALLYESDEVGQARQRHEELYLQLLALFALTLVVGLAIFVLLFRQIVKTNNAVIAKEQAANQAIAARKELELAINSISEGFIVYDQHDRVELFNQRYVELHPMQADDLVVGVTFQDLLRAAVRNGGVKIPEDEVEDWIASITAKRRSTVATTFESRVAEGHWLQISERRTSDGRLVCVHTDITELKERETLIRQKSDLLQTTLDNMKQGIAVFDQDAKLTLFNNQYLEINQYPKVAVYTSREYREIARFAAERGDFGPGDPDALINSQVAAIENLLRDGTGNLRQQRRLRDGQAVVETVVTALPTGGFVKTYEDITARVTAEAERNRLTEMYHAAQKTQALGTLAGGIAHDFNNIIGSIIGNCSLLIADASTGDPARDRLQQILESGTRARDLVRQILIYSRNAESEIKSLDLGQTIQGSLSSLQSMMPANVVLEAAKIEPCMIEGDATQIHQVLLNVCVNAAQAIGEEQGRIEVSAENVEITADDLEQDSRNNRRQQGSTVVIHGRAGTLQEGRYARLTVTDTGDGIPEEVMPRIFEPFYTTKEVGQGTGLGLAAVHGIVRNHGVAIVVESMPDIGTRFDFYFPLIGDAKPVVTEEPPEATTEGGSERVMLIDDDRALLTVTEDILARLGYTVEAYQEPERALDVFQGKPNAWDLVITDRSMPKMMGEDLVRAMKATRADLPVLMLSGFVSSEDSEKLTSLGIGAVVGKPVLPDELAAAVRSVLDTPASKTQGDATEATVPV